VEPGENLAAIATRYKSTPHCLPVRTGSKKGADLAAGDRLVIPAGYHEAAPKPVRAAAVNPKAKSGRRSGGIGERRLRPGSRRWHGRTSCGYGSLIR